MGSVTEEVDERMEPICVNSETLIIVSGVNDSDEKPEEVENPIFNVCILDHVFSYLSFEDVKNCTLVCPSWFIEARRWLKINSVLNFNGSRINYPVNRHEKYPAYRTVAEYMATITSQNLLSRTCCLGLGARVSESLEAHKEFFYTYGPEIANLIILYPFNFHHLFNLRLLREWMIHDLLNLTRLDLRNTPGPVRFWLEAFGPHPTFLTIKRICLPTDINRAFIQDIIKSCPNLCAIEVSDPIDFTLDKNRTSFHVLETLRDNPELASKLTELKFFSVSAYELEILSGLNIQLKVLHLGTFSAFYDEHCIETILDNHKDSLEELEFTSPYRFYPVVFELPCFPKLKMLLISHWYGPRTSFSLAFPPLNYAQQLPVLKNLVVRPLFKDGHESYERFLEYFWETDLYQSIFVGDGQVCNTLRTLEIPLPENEMSDRALAILQRLETLFPTVFL